MKYSFKIFFAVIATLLFRGIAIAQIPMEVFSGHKKATVDIMFFKLIKNKEGHNSKFLFFNRNSVRIDYTMTQTTNLPQFGFTEVFSYNHEKLKGFAPVVVASSLNRGVYPKQGYNLPKSVETIPILAFIQSRDTICQNQ